MIAVAKEIIVPLYKEPSINSERVDELLYGMQAEIELLPCTLYVYVTTRYGYTGYARKSCFEVGEKAEDFIAATGYVVTAAYADVLSAPKVQGKLLKSLVRGSRIGYLGRGQNGWSMVTLCGGKTGFMRDLFIAPPKRRGDFPDEDSYRRSLVDTAKQYLGVQYRWGGKSPLGIDCSGLCSISYLLNDVYIYRDAKIQPQFCMRKIPFDKIKPGDLLYFPGHVAMYIGDDTVIHSTGKYSGVVYGSLTPDGKYPYLDILPSLSYCGTIF